MKLARKMEPAADHHDPRYTLIELMFFAYRDFVEDADRALVSDGFGRAHHRVLYFVARRPGLTVAELLDILKITKQSLNRVLKDLLDRGYVTNRLGEADRRQRRLSATPRGEALVRAIAEIQSARFAKAFAQLGPTAETDAAAFLHAMVDSEAQHIGCVEGRAGDAFDRRGEAKSPGSCAAVARDPDVGPASQLSPIRLV